MGLKQDVIVVNEFTTPTRSGKGSRGGTPGNYVTRYMARADAVEDLTPVRYQDHDAYVTRYMARKEATEQYDSVARIKQGMRQAQGLGGIAFGCENNSDNGDISMSHRKIKRVSRDIQHQFEYGKTVMKTVVSFDLPYLQRTGVVSKDFTPKRKGDYRGNVDQMKLRLAIMHGMERLSKRFDNLEWVGVIQVDTMHVHCHLCMVDKGEGRLMPDGTQKGKLSSNDIRTLRRGIDMRLDSMQPVVMLASNVSYDRRNARCFIKKYTHEAMAQNSLPQLLIACLPKDKRLWRASTHDKSMLKANTITKQFVMEVLEQPDSGYREALREIDAYAQARQSRERLDGKQYRQLVKQGKDRLIGDCMNGVYSVLKQVPERQLRTRTPMLDIMSMEYTDMAQEAKSDPMIEFGFKLRSYSSRLDHHKRQYEHYHKERAHYEDAEDKNQTAISSQALYQFYLQEEEYNAMLMAKYQYFLSFLPSDEEYEDEFTSLMNYRKRIESMDSMMHDASFRRRSEDSAEDYGLRVYGLKGGRFMVSNPQLLERRYSNMQDRYGRKADDFKARLATLGMSLHEQDDGKSGSDEHAGGTGGKRDGSTLQVRKTPPYAFNDVKALDLHHLAYDFPFDVPVGERNVNNFIACSRKRWQAFEEACSYLKDTGQEDFIATMPVKDIQLMRDVADRFEKGLSVIPSAKSGGATRRRAARTVSLADDFESDMKLAVRSVVGSVEMTQE